MVRHWLYCAAALLWACAATRVLFLLLWRRPVRARTLGTNLTEMQRRHEAHMHFVARFDGVPSTDDIAVRGVLARVAYEVDGIEYGADVRQIADKGEQPECHPIIWYDPADPRRVTACGPGAMVTPILIGGALIVVGATCDF